MMSDYKTLRTWAMFLMVLGVMSAIAMRRVTRWPIPPSDGITPSPEPRSVPGFRRPPDS